MLAVVSMSTGPLFAQDEPVQPQGNSYEELFMGLQRPFGERTKSPAPSANPEGTVAALYADEIFFNLRNSFPKPTTDHLAPCFSQSLLVHFDKSRTAIDAWMSKHRGQMLKLPLGEGSIFLSCYEGGTKFKVGSAVIKGERAEVPVQLVYQEPNAKPYEWTDVAVLVRVGERWLLDDILFAPAERQNYTLRQRVMPEAGHASSGEVEGAVFCVAYELRDVGERDRRPADRLDPLSGGEGGILRRSVLNAKSVVDVAALASRAQKQKLLTAPAYFAAIKAMNTSSKRYPVMECYDPHHVVVFYGSVGEPIAAIEVCFKCNHIMTSGTLNGSTPSGALYEDSDLEAFAQFFRDAGLPATATPQKDKEATDADAPKVLKKP